jgi:hypothetical protein
MVHFTCDLCGKDMTATGDARYVVKIAAYAGFDPDEITEDDLDEAHMEAISELLQHEAELDPVDLESSSYKGFRYDLCSSCHERFLKDPLNRDPLRSLDFSKN